MLGNRGGAVISGAVGGMISSTAVTAAMTTKSHTARGNTAPLVTATLIASMIMTARVILVSGFYNPAILQAIFLPALAMLIGLGGTAWYFYKQSNTQSETLQTSSDDEYRSPFNLLSAIKFSSVIVAIKFIAGIGLVYQEIINPKIFYYVLGMISGLADVDAITMEMAGKTIDGSLSLIIAATTILIAVIANNCVKAALAYRMGEKTFGKQVVTGFGISIFLGLVVILLINIASRLS